MRRHTAVLSVVLCSVLSVTGCKSTKHAGTTTPPKVGDITGVGDRAATASASLPVQGHTIGISAIYILKGATFLSYSDLVLDKPAPTVAALAVQSTVSLSRIP